MPFRSVASHLVRLSRGAREAFRLDVLRPPAFSELARVLEAANNAGEPYQVVHFDGHGTWLDEETAAAAGGAPGGGFSREVFSLVSPPRPGSHGFLVFEDPAGGGKQQLVDGPALGAVLAGAGVSVLVLNACRSAHADLATQPDTVTGEGEAHRRVRAYGSLAQEVMDAGVAGVAAMRYNVYVVTAARFIGEVYAGLLAGQPLGGAVSAARRQLAADPQRQVGGRPLPLQDWMVPVVYEAAPLALLPPQQGQDELSIDLSQADAGKERAGLESGLPAGPDAGFFGRDETLLALDRAFDRHRVVLLHAWAGAGKTSTVLEFARWYALTGGTAGVLFTSFEHHLTLARLLDQVGGQFGPALEGAGVQWATLDDAGRREVALRLLAQVPVLWIWDNIEPVAGFPAGTDSAWTPAEQQELAGFLRDLADQTRCRVLLTSRRDERGWLGDLPARVALPPMPMLERLELARAVASRQPGGREEFLEVEDWRPLLAFTQGNPLTVTILVRQALRARHTSKDQIQAFVEQLRAGAAAVTDDAAQGRGASLAASLDYGFTQAFTDDERAILALLALFQGFTDIDTLVSMGAGDDPVPAIAGLDREAGIALLDQAADVGLLTGYGDGYYAVHPAIPWHLHALFTQHYGPDGSPPALAAARAWTTATSQLGNYYHDQYAPGSHSGDRRAGGGGGQPAAGPPPGPHPPLAPPGHRRHAGPAHPLRAHRAGHRMAAAGRGAGARVHRPGHRRPPPRPRRGMGPAHQLPGPHRPGRPQLAGRRGTPERRHRLAPRAGRRLRSTSPPANSTTGSAPRSVSLASALRDLGQILREQDDPGCVQPYQEAMELLPAGRRPARRSHRRVQPRARLQGHPGPAGPRPGRAVVPALP